MTASEHKTAAHKQFFTQYDRYLDLHRERDWLGRPEVASMVRENLYHHHGEKYYLLAFCIMVTHVHVLLQPSEPLEFDPDAPVSDELPDEHSPLAQIMHSLKSYTAHEANKLLGRSGQFWQHESYDHWVREDEEFGRIVDYIAGNPVSAGLVDEPQEWPWSSAHDRFLIDGGRTGLITYPR